MPNRCFLFLLLGNICPIKYGVSVPYNAYNTPNNEQKPNSSVYHCLFLENSGEGFSFIYSNKSNSHTTTRN
jgi:hypothetical protein